MALLKKKRISNEKIVKMNVVFLLLITIISEAAQFSKLDNKIIKLIVIITIILRTFPWLTVVC